MAAPITTLLTSMTSMADPSTITPSPTWAAAVDARDWIFGTNTEGTTIPVIIPYDDTPVTSTQIVFCKIYVYGGLIFFFGTVITFLGWYIHILIVEKKFYDLPDDLRFDIDFMRATENLPRRPGYFVHAYEDNPEWQRMQAARRAMDERMKTETQKRTERLAQKNERTKKFISDALTAKKRAHELRITWAASMATLYMDQPLDPDEIADEVKKHQTRSGVTLAKSTVEKQRQFILISAANLDPPGSQNRYTPRRPSPLRFSKSFERPAGQPKSPRSSVGPRRRSPIPGPRPQKPSRHNLTATAVSAHTDHILSTTPWDSEKRDEEADEAMPHLSLRQPAPASASPVKPLIPRRAALPAHLRGGDHILPEESGESAQRAALDHDNAERGRNNEPHCTCKDRKPFDSIDFLIMKGMCDVHRFR